LANDLRSHELDAAVDVINELCQFFLVFVGDLPLSPDLIFILIEQPANINILQRPLHSLHYFMAVPIDQLPLLWTAHYNDWKKLGRADIHAGGHEAAVVVAFELLVQVLERQARLLYRI
jgi:hypothetical protein